MRRRMLLIGVLAISLALNGAGLLYYLHAKHYVGYVSEQLARGYAGVYRALRSNIWLLDEALERGTISTSEVERFITQSNAMLYPIQDFIGLTDRLKRLPREEMQRLTLHVDHSRIRDTMYSLSGRSVIPVSGQLHAQVPDESAPEPVYPLNERDQYNLQIARDVYELWLDTFHRQFGPAGADPFMLYVQGRPYYETDFYRKGATEKDWVELLLRMEQSLARYVAGREPGTRYLEDLFIRPS